VRGFGIPFSLGWGAEERVRMGQLHGSG
jgi:hypothetical protein